MQFNTKYNVGDTVWSVGPYGNEQISTNEPCPKCKTGCDYSYMYFGDYAAYRAQCNDGKLEYIRHKWMPIERKVLEITAWASEELHTIDYLCTGKMQEIDEDELYASGSEAKSEASRIDALCAQELNDLVNGKWGNPRKER